jgi:hypothetical protein
MVVCKNCGWSGAKGKKQVRGSLFFELILWLFLIVPGVIYSIWRLTTKETVCPTCGKPELIPATSPMGKELLTRLGSKS